MRDHAEFAAIDEALTNRVTAAVDEWVDYQSRCEDNRNDRAMIVMVMHTFALVFLFIFLASMMLLMFGLAR